MTRRLFATPTGIALWAGLVAVIAGVVVFVTAPTASFGWFAYAPLSDTVFTPATHSWQQVVGVAVTAAGAIVAAFAAGRLSVRRPR